ncbi:MAG: hemolysin family protein [Owenweeksia sp.]
MALLIFYLLLALVVSFFCSILEAVLLSITPSYIETQLQQNKKWAHRLFHFKSNIDRPLSAILSLNTISHTVGAAGVGAQAGIVFANVSVGVISGVLTLLILIFSEIIPKTLGAGYWRNLAYFTTRSLSVLTIAMYPLVWLSERLTRLFKKKNEPSIERSEITALAEVGRKEGVFTLEEAAILKNLINLRKTMVRDIMTPRTMMVVAHEKMSIRDFFKDDSFDQISRVPLYTESKDDVSGFIHKNDVMLNLSKKEEDMLLCDIKRELPVVNEDKSIYDLYNFLIKHRHHIALVKGEYGGTAGIVTMEDVLETLLGYEIIDEFDKTSDLQEHARKSWREKARRLGVFGTSTKDRSSP